jgi:murein DD-endopeptidase MepM/ murein hydrolase activator NlpD
LKPLGAVIEKDEAAAAPRGGPFIPAAGLHFSERTAMLAHTLDEIAAWKRAAAAMPLGPPVRATAISSGFGYRKDPFLHRPALHAGLDFVAPSGTEVRATAPGVVVSAGWSGGYGQMVEIRHANGVSTRYGHLSQVLVGSGASVSAGTLVGRVGSTGRSTGPHLHYETRREGSAVDPQAYLSAGRAIGM